MVAVVGISGGLAALIASLYAAVERKRQPLGVMRLGSRSKPTVSRSRPATPRCLPAGTWYAALIWW